MPPNLETVTKIIILSVTVLLLAWTSFAAHVDPKNTVSNVIARYARQQPLIPFFFGLLMGHFFWPLG